MLFFNANIGGYTIEMTINNTERVICMEIQDGASVTVEMFKDNELEAKRYLNHLRRELGKELKIKKATKKMNGKALQVLYARPYKEVVFAVIFP